MQGKGPDISNGPFDAPRDVKGKCLREAALAAAAAAPANATTVLVGDGELRPLKTDTAFKAPAPPRFGDVTPTQVTIVNLGSRLPNVAPPADTTPDSSDAVPDPNASTGRVNALAALLGYSDASSEGEPSDSEDDSSAAHRQPQTSTAMPMSTSAIAAPTALLAEVAGALSHPATSALEAPAADADAVSLDAAPDTVGDMMDLELASFMKELESSGLLADAPSLTADAAGGLQPTINSAAQQSSAATSAADAEQPVQAHGAAAVAATEVQPSAAAASQAAGAFNTVAAADDSMEGQESEQKLLGYLAQAPEWSKCLDTGSGKVYYWNLSSNEVVWEVPGGYNPDSLLPAEEAVEGTGMEASGPSDPLAAADSAAAAHHHADGTGSGAAGVDDVLPRTEPLLGPTDALAVANTGQEGGAAKDALAEAASKHAASDNEGVSATPVVRTEAIMVSDSAVSGPSSTLGLGMYGPEAADEGGQGSAVQAANNPAPAAVSLEPIAVVGAAATHAAKEDDEMEDGQLPASDTPERPPHSLEDCNNRVRAVSPKIEAGTDTGLDLTSILLQPPQSQETDDALSDLLQQMQQSAQFFLLSIPAIVKSALEAQVRWADWLALSSLQARAVASGRPEEGHSWRVYQQYVTTKLQALQAAAPAAMLDAQHSQQQAQGKGFSFSPPAAQSGAGVGEGTDAAGSAASTGADLHITASRGKPSTHAAAATDGGAVAAPMAGKSGPAAEGEAKPPPLPRKAKAHRRGNKSSAAAAMAAAAAAAAVYAHAGPAAAPLYGNGAPPYPSYASAGLRPGLDAVPASYSWIGHAAYHQYQAAQSAYGYDPATAAYFNSGFAQTATGMQPYHSAPEYGLPGVAAAGVAAPPLPGAIVAAAAVPDTAAASPPPLPPSEPPPLPGEETGAVGPPGSSAAWASQLPSSAPLPYASPPPPLPYDPGSAAPPAASPAISSSSEGSDMDEDDSDEIPHTTAANVFVPNTGFPQTTPLSQLGGLQHPYSHSNPTSVVGMQDMSAVPAVASAASAYAPVAQEALQFAHEQLAAHSGGAYGAVRAVEGAAVEATAAAPASVPVATPAASAAVEVPKKKRKADAAGTSVASKKSKQLPGKMSALLSQWGSVRKTLEDEEAKAVAQEEEAFDPKARERKRLAEIEAWKAEQLTSGSAEANANFQPIGDWRSRFPAAQKAAEAGSKPGSGPTATSSTPTTSKMPTGSKSKSKPVASVPVASTTAPTTTAIPSSKSSKSTVADAADIASGRGHGKKVASGTAAVKPPVYPTNSKTRPDLDALSAGLPSGWRAMWDKTSGDIYYGNLSTKATSWDRPKG